MIYVEYFGEQLDVSIEQFANNCELGQRQKFPWKADFMTKRLRFPLNEKQHMKPLLRNCENEYF